MFLRIMPVLKNHRGVVRDLDLPTTLVIHVEQLARCVCPCPDSNFQTKISFGSP